MGAAGSVEISGAGRLCGHCWAPRPDARATKGLPAKIVDISFFMSVLDVSGKVVKFWVFFCHSFGFKTQLLSFSTVLKPLYISTLGDFPVDPLSTQKVGEHQCASSWPNITDPSLAPFVHLGSCRRHLNGCHSYVSQPWWLGFHFSTSDRENQSLRIMDTRFLLPGPRKPKPNPLPKKIHSISPQSYCN